jgi:hypothetical protein
MARLHRSTFPNVMPLVLIFSLAVVKPVSADDLTGSPHDDPKDFVPPSIQESSPQQIGASAFQPMPYWAHDASMPPLPQALKPMGTKVAVLTTPPVPAPSLAPPKDSNSSTVEVEKPRVVTPMPKTVPAPNPALVAVSPFLEWIKSNPQAAAEQARQQASAYQAGADSNAPAPASGTNPNPAPNAPAPASASAAPYWMPPLIDASQFGTGSVGGSSAAIYSTPQR